MTIEVASLVLGIDSKDANRASDALDKMTQSGARTEEAAKRVKRSWESTIERVASEAAALNGRFDTLNSTQARMLAAVERVASQLDRMAAAMDRVTGHTGATTQAVDKAAQAIDKVDRQAAAATENVRKYGSATKLSAETALANVNAMGRLQQAIGVTVTQSNSLTAAATRTAGGLEDVGDEAAGAAGGLQEVEKKAAGAGRQIGVMDGLVRRAIAAFGAWKIIDSADQWGQLTSRLDIATNSTGELIEAQTRLMDISNRAYKDFGNSSELFIRTSETMRELGYSSSQALDMVEALTYGLVVSAADTQRSASVIDQWSKAIQLGKLGMEGYQTIVAYAPRLQKALADSLGVTTSELMRMVMAGELTTEKMVGVTSQMEKLGAEADQMPVTVRDALTVLDNSFMRWIGTVNEGTGAIGVLTGALDLVSENIGAVVAIAGTLVAIKAAAWLTAIAVASVNAAKGMLAASTAATALSRSIGLLGGPLGWIVTGIGAAITAWELFGRKATSSAAEAERAAGTAGVAARQASAEIMTALDAVIEKYKEAARARGLAFGAVDDPVDAARKALERESMALRELGERYARYQNIAAASGGLPSISEEIQEARRQAALLPIEIDKTARDVAEKYAKLQEALSGRYEEYVNDSSRLTKAEQRANDILKANAAFDRAVEGLEKGSERYLTAEKRLEAELKGIDERYKDKSGSGARDLLGRLGLAGIENDLARTAALIDSALGQVEAAYQRGDMGTHRYYQQRIALAEASATAQESALRREIEALSTLDATGKSGQQIRERLAAAETKLAIARAKNSAEISGLREQEEAYFRGPSLKNIRVLEDQERALEEQNHALQEQIEFFGLTGFEIERLRVARLDEMLAQQYAALATAQSNDVAQVEIDRINDLIAALFNLRNAREASAGLQGRHEAQQKEQARIEASVQSWGRGIDKIGELFVEGFSASLDKNDDAFKAFTDNAGKALKNSVATALYEATLKPIVIRFVAQMAGMVGGSGVQEGILKQAGLDVGSLFGGGNLFSNFGGGVGQLAQNVGHSLWEAGFKDIGSSLADNAYKIGEVANIAGDLLGYGKAIFDVTQGKWGSAAGTAIGTYFGGPVGAAIGSMLGGLLDGAFAGEARYGGTYQYRPGQGTERPGWAAGDAGPAAMQFADNLLRNASDAIQRAFSAAGSDVLLTALEASFESSEKGRGGTHSGGVLMIDGHEIRFGTSAKGQGYGGTNGTVEEMMANAEIDVYQTVIQAMQAGRDQFPRMIREALDGVDADSLNLEQAQQFIQTIVGTLEQIGALAAALGALPFVPAVAETFDFAAALAEAAGGAENAANLFSSFYQNYVRESERAAHLTDQLTREFADLGYELPKTRDEMFALVQANLALGEAGAQTVAKLLGMEAALSSLLPAFGGATDASALFDAQLQAVRDASAEASRLLGMRNTAGSLLDRINRNTSFGGLREAELWAAMSTASYEQQIQLASELTDIVLARYDTELASIERIRDISRSLRDYLDSLSTSDLAPANLATKVSEAERQLADAVARARAGDEDALQSIQGLTQNALELWRRYGASGDAYQDAYNRITGTVGDLADQAMSDADRQLSVSQNTLAELESLRGVAQTAYDTIDAQYQAARLSLENEGYILAELGAQTGQLDSLGDIMRGWPAELAAILQPFLQQAAGGVVSGWYQGTGITPDQSATDYWTGQLGSRPQDQVQSDFYKTIVSDWYRDQLGWAGDQAGIEYWAEQAKAMGAAQAYEDFLRTASLHGSHRAGLDYVPFDGYRAELHAGERVLTAAENRAYSMPDWSQYGRNDALLAEVKALRVSNEKLTAEVAALRRENNQGHAGNIQATNQSGGRVAEAIGGRDWENHIRSR